MLLPSFSSSSCYFSSCSSCFCSSSSCSSCFLQMCRHHLSFSWSESLATWCSQQLSNLLIRIIRLALLLGCLTPEAERSEVTASEGLFSRSSFSCVLNVHSVLVCFWLRGSLNKPLSHSVARGGATCWRGLQVQPSPLLTTRTESPPLCWRHCIPLRRQNTALVLSEMILTPRLPSSSSSSASCCHHFFSQLLFPYSFTSHHCQIFLKATMRTLVLWNNPEDAVRTR